MSALALVNALAAVAGLVVAALALFRGAKSPLALPLALMAIDQFAWNAATVGLDLTKDGRYSWLGAVAAPLFVPFLFHFVLVFVGHSRSHRRAMVAAYVALGSVSALTLVDFLTPFDVPWGLRGYSAAILVCSLPVAAVGIRLAIGHWRTAPTSQERGRARQLLMAVCVAVALLVTDLLADVGAPVPRLASLGSFAFNALMAHLALGLGLFGRRRLSGMLPQALLLGLFVAVAYLAVFSVFAGSLGWLVVATTAVTLGGLALLQRAAVSAAESRSGLERFAALGRFSAQMAHDLKNPLAAARGATQYLMEEVRRGKPVSDTEFVGLVLEQLERLGRIIDRYQRLSSTEPELAEVDLNQLVEKVLVLQAFAGSTVTVRRELSEGAPRAQLDADLVASALENLVKNAIEAMPNGGEVTVRTAADARAVRLQVQDTGVGMDARAQEQAFELFYTSKTTGSGLGLAFVRQVARAHHGEATLSSREGQGTLVELSFPRAGQGQYTARE